MRSTDNVRGHEDSHELQNHEQLINRRDFGLALQCLGASAILGGLAKPALGDDEESARSNADDVVDVTKQAESATTSTVSQTGPLLRDMGIEVPYLGKPTPLGKFLGGKATLVVNPKIDDPESLNQVRSP